MEQETKIEFRTRSHNVRVADVVVKKDAVVFIVKHKSKVDQFTLDELIKKIYGQGVRCVVYNCNNQILMEI